MTKNELMAKVNEYKSYKAMAKELEAEMNKLESELKKELEDNNVSEMIIGDSIVRYAEYTTSRFDSKSFKAEYSKLYAEYTKEVLNHRFSVA